MFMFANFIAFSSLITLIVGSTEIPDYEDFVDLICQEIPIEESARCMGKLPEKGKDIIKECSRSFGVEIENEMKKAVESYCYKEDIRNELLLCYEKELSSLYETTSTSEERLQMDEFQLCLQIVMDQLLEEK